MRRKLIRRIGVLVVLGMLLTLAFSTPVVAPSHDYALDAFDGSPTEVVYVDADGEVGIGDTSPDFKLEVTGSSGSGYFGVTSSSYLSFILSGILAWFF